MFECVAVSFGQPLVLPARGQDRPWIRSLHHRGVDCATGAGGSVVVQLLSATRPSEALFGMWMTLTDGEVSRRPTPEQGWRMNRKWKVDAAHTMLRQQRSLEHSDDPRLARLLDGYTYHLQGLLMLPCLELLRALVAGWLGCLAWSDGSPSARPGART